DVEELGGRVAGRAGRRIAASGSGVCDRGGSLARGHGRIVRLRLAACTARTRRRWRAVLVGARSPSPRSSTLQAMTPLTWLGHGSFRLDTPGGTRLYVDPFL